MMIIIKNILNKTDNCQLLICQLKKRVIARNIATKQSRLTTDDSVRRRLCLRRNKSKALLCASRATCFYIRRSGTLRRTEDTQCIAQAVRLDALGRKNDAGFWMHSVRNASCRAVLYYTKRLIPDGMIIFKSLNFEIIKLKNVNGQ
jgi:hypothetical protein